MNQRKESRCLMILSDICSFVHNFFITISQFFYFLFTFTDNLGIMWLIWRGFPAGHLSKTQTDRLEGPKDFIFMR